MSYSIYSYAERPELDDLAIPSLDVWPEYNLHGDIVNAHWGALWDDFPEYQLFLVDDASGAVLAELQTAPLYWDGTIEGLSSGVDESLVAAIEGRRNNTTPNSLCAFAAKVALHARSQGLAIEGVKAMRDLAAHHGFGHFIAPLRPSQKHRYPITSIDDYVSWTREDGLAFDPWLRVHQRLGGRVARTIPNSLRISGTVAEWESWTSMQFPGDGDFTFPDGLAPVRIDHAQDLGQYYEPNVWVIHEV